jgi:hypothetical protein
LNVRFYCDVFSVKDGEREHQKNIHSSVGDRCRLGGAILYTDSEGL